MTGRRRRGRFVTVPALVALVFAAMIWASERTPERDFVTSTRAGGARTAMAGRHFGWARKPGAAAYRVELFHGPARLFVARTTRTQITIPSSWTFEGKRHRLEQGDYVVYVWALAPGHAAEMIVQAKMVVPHR